MNAPENDTEKIGSVEKIVDVEPQTAMEQPSTENTYEAQEFGNLMEKVCHDLLGEPAEECQCDDCKRTRGELPRAAPAIAVAIQDVKGERHLIVMSVTEARLIWNHLGEVLQVIHSGDKKDVEA